ncbi:MAG: NAD(P)H-hydrate dehydratase [Actinobacteria bacterium]|nr:NAD(P)H-hydrate dehydratase [Actinomycetota bacterium]
MFEPLYTAEEMRRAEQGHDVTELIERAGRAVAELALEELGDRRSYTVVCGPGMNGADGRVAARLLREAGRSVRVVEAKTEEEPKELGEPDVIVDALFGTGFTGAPRPQAARLIEEVNALADRLGAEVVAVDCPSGIDASTGEVAGAAIRADRTLALHAEKVGLRVTPGAFYAGRTETADIGLTAVETRHAQVASEVLDAVPLRAREDNKYTAGHVLVVGGSPGLTGAACLVAMAALRADAGYVTVAGPRSTLPTLEARLLEPVKRPLPEDEDGRVTAEAFDVVEELAERAGAVAVGPGLGRSDGTKELVRRLLAELELPVVVDADALWELEPGDWPAPRVLTPHAGELARLLGETSAWVDAHRLAAVERAVDRFECVVLLKGEGTLVSAPGATALVCEGFPSLATAGTGDVLTGIIGSFLAKGMDARLAGASGARAQFEAAIVAPQRAGLVAGDLLEALPEVLE